MDRGGRGSSKLYDAFGIKKVREQKGTFRELFPSSQM
jgi:hypothetical protein